MINRPRVSFSDELVYEDPLTPAPEEQTQEPPVEPERSLSVMQASTLALAIEVFNEIDADHTRSIDFQQTVAWWSSNFAKVNAFAMFDSVDEDKDGRITLEEWVNFWQTVRGHSHLDAEIEEELTNIRQGRSWVVFQDMPPVSRD